MEAGTVVADRFVVELRAGAGGMGVVHRALDRVTGERVALKVLQPTELSSVERFAREAELLAELEHPAIVRYVAHGTTPQGEPFLAMEWIEGEGLRRRLALGPLGVSATVHLAQRLAGALGAAHARGVVHRDVKPDNVLLAGGRIEEAKLLDFGLARRASVLSSVTRSGIVVGTPGYMSPEQARGDRDIDARSDVFALGCVLFECLTGQPPFAAATVVGVLAKILFEEATRTSELQPSVPPDLEDLVALLLAKDPRERPADGNEVLRELGLLGGGRPSRLSLGPVALTRTERRVVSIVVAHAGRPLDAGATLSLHASRDVLEELRALVEDPGGRVELLYDGSLVASFDGARAATDQARAAALVALRFAAALPAAPIGVATGRGLVDGRVPLGEAIERAVGLSSAAAPGKVRIDDVTAGLLDAGFDVVVGDGGASWLAGRREHVDTARTLLGRESPCVGRERELAVLGAVLDETVRERVARAVLVTAEAGVGKSRLRFELVRRARERSDPPVAAWLARGDPMSAGSSFGLVASALRSLAGLGADEPSEVSHWRLLQRVGRHLSAEEAPRTAALLAAMIGLEPDAERASLLPAAARGDPVVLGDAMRRAFVGWLAAECAAQPVLLVLEDVHWGDLASLRLVDAALRECRALPLMVLGLGRPDVHDLFPGLWAERDVLHLRLPELSPASAERLVRAALGERVDPALASRLAERSAGNAFYLEELIRAVADGRGEVVPETVLAMMQARLEALPVETRRVLRAASVFGTSFWEAGVAELLGRGRRAAQLPRMLDKLAEDELVTRRPVSRLRGHVEHVFRHALVRDAAYAMLTDADRTLGHRMAARWLEQVGETDAGVLAEHLERAIEPAAAIVHYQRAAEQALAGNDLDATLARAARGIACGASGPALGVLRRLEAEAHRWRGDNVAAERAAREALALLPEGGDAWYGAADPYVVAATLLGDRPALEAIVEQLRRVEPQPGAGPARLMSWARAAVCLRLLGSNEHADALLAALEERRGWEGAAATDHPGVAACVFQIQALEALVRGNPARYCELHRAAAWWLDQAGDSRSACETRVNIGYALMELGAYDEAEQALREVLDEAQRIGLPILEAVAKHNLGMVLARRGALDEGKRLELEALEALLPQGNQRFEGASRIYLATILLLRGEHAPAEQEASAAAALFADQPALRAFALATQADVQLRAGRAADALLSSTEALGLVESAGEVEEGEALVRLVHAQALGETGRWPEAQRAMARARERLLERAAKIDDARWRASFLERVPENARTMAIARTWLD